MKQIEIFYADDDEDDLMFFKEATDKISSEINTQIDLHVHINGDALIENIKNSKAENGVVFLDINMPLRSGFELLEAIRKDTEISHFPVVMYSTSSNQDNIDKSRSLGANFYVIKPYRFENLKNMILEFVQLDWKNITSDPKTFLYR